MDHDTKASPRLFRMVKVNGRWGFIDEKGNMAIQPVFGDAEPFAEGLAVVWKKPWGPSGMPPPFSVIDENGETVIADYDALPDTTFADGFLRVAEVRDGYKCYYLDRFGVKHFANRFISASGFKNQLALARVDEVECFINTSGEVVVRTDYKLVSHFSDGFAMVANDWSKNGIIDANGDIVLEPTTKLLDHTLAEGTALFRDAKGFYYGDVTGKPLFDNLYFRHGPMRNVRCQSIFEYFDALHRYGLKAFWSYGKPTIPEYVPSTFTDGIAAYCHRERGLIGFIDRSGRIMKVKYRNVLSYYSEGLCAVMLECGRVVYINKMGDEVIDVGNCTSAGEFQDGLAPIRFGKKLGYINRKGEYVWKPRE